MRRLHRPLSPRLPRHLRRRRRLRGTGHPGQRGVLAATVAAMPQPGSFSASGAPELDRSVVDELRRIFNPQQFDSFPGRGAR